jgi:hypothetical protein
MRKVSMYCKTVSDNMLEDGAPITNPLFWIIILLLLGKRQSRKNANETYKGTECL